MTYLKSMRISDLQTRISDKAFSARANLNQIGGSHNRRQLHLSSIELRMGP